MAYPEPGPNPKVLLANCISAGSDMAEGSKPNPHPDCPELDCRPTHCHAVLNTILNLSLTEGMLNSMESQMVSIMGGTPLKKPSAINRTETSIDKNGYSQSGTPEIMK